MKKTKWLQKKIKNENTDKLIYNPLNIDLDILKIINSRGLEIDQNLENIDPFLLKDVSKAVDKLIECKGNNEEIWIYGDYDVDGITSVALCYLALTDLDFNIKYYIPLRDEGYGLNKEALKYIKEQGGKTIITVDCGVSSVEEVEYANSIGLEMIITDHHEINRELPNAFAVINPKRDDNEYPFKYLAGVGTAFMLLLALMKKLKVEKNIEKYLSIVAIGTIADIVPLVNDNRLFAKEGLKLINKTNFLGFNMLISRLFPDYENRKFSTYDVGFIIAPVFNAAGRLTDAKNAVDLFVEKDRKKCIDIINKLIDNNTERKQIQASILEKTLEEIERKKLNERSLILVANKEFHHGVIGIVASKIVDKFYKPSIIMEIKEDEGIATASCRSIESINIVEALNSVSDLLLRYGGHAGAAGFSIKIENIDKFYTEIEKYISSVTNEDDFIKPIYIEKELPIYKVAYNFIKDMELLEPFGAANSTPIFSIRNCKFDRLRYIGRDKNHLMMDIIKDDIVIRNTVWFNADDIFNELSSLKNIDIAFKLKLESYKDVLQYKIFIEDIKKSDQPSNRLEEVFSIYDTVFPIKSVFYTRRKELSNNLMLDFTNSKLNIISNRICVGNLDEQTSYLLKTLKDKYNMNFKLKITDRIDLAENSNIFIEIQRDYSFNSYAIKTPKLFNEIKYFLIGDFKYNKIEQLTLASVFKDKRKTLSILELGRGLSTIINTISIFYKSNSKKVLLISDINFNSEYFDCSNKYIDNYDFYIVLNPSTDTEIKKISGTNILVLSNSDINIEDFNKISDSYDINKNITIVSEEELLNKDIVYSKKLPIGEKANIIKNINSFHEIFSTEDIKIFF